MSRIVYYGEHFLHHMLSEVPQHDLTRTWVDAKAVFFIDLLHRQYMQGVQR